MVGGTICRNPYETGQALIAWSLSEWRYFDGWAASQKVNLLEVSCPRFIHLIYHYITKDMDSEGRAKFEAVLEEIESEVQFKKGKEAEKEAGESRDIEETEDGTKIIIPNNPWKAPPGWTPPGWASDEENMKNAQAFMGWSPGTGGAN